MNLTESDIAILILKKLRRQLTAEDRIQLDDWIRHSEGNQKKYQELTDFYALQLKRKEYLAAEQKAEQFQLPNLASGETRPENGRLRFMPSRNAWLVAASIIVVLAIGLFLYTSKDKQPAPIAVTASKDIPAPVTNRAMITLADGSQVFLDSVGNGPLARLGNVKLVKLANGQIAYQAADGQILKELQYNTLTNPKGSKVIDMMLSDGSHVWLNAGSSITYPVAFIGEERKVELRGEGYFEVAHDSNKRFIVSANGVKTEVLGTHFNINAYNENAVTKVTLLEGSVRTSSNAGFVIIKPGQQAQVTDRIKVVPADLDQVMAWHNGLFYLNNQSIGEVMQQISNWYDVAVVYRSGIPNFELYGEMGRDLSLSQVLKVLQKVGLQCKLENHKLIIN